MGKSMSTARQVSPKFATQQKPVHEFVQKVVPTSTVPDGKYLQSVNSIDRSFNDRLKKVFVTSLNENDTSNVVENRSQIRKPNMLFVNDIKIMLLNYKSNPDIWTLDYISKKFDIKREIAEKIVSQYSTLETFYAKSTSQSDQHLSRSEPVNKIHPNSTLFEVEEFMVKDKTNMWKPFNPK